MHFFFGNCAIFHLHPIPFYPCLSSCLFSYLSIEIGKKRFSFHNQNSILKGNFNFLLYFFLHHFDAAGLSALLSQIAGRTRVLIACEPRRSSSALMGSHLLGLIGCNDVSRHDAVVSVRAGFIDRELSGLWPDRAAWTLQEQAYGLFSHYFVATRASRERRALPEPAQ